MTAYADIAVAVLAAGQGRRFGSDKLIADLDGTPMGLRIAQTLKQIPFGWRFAVCSKGAALVHHFSALGFQVVVNDNPETGQAHSLHLVVEAAYTTEAKALLVVLADMPFVTKCHIEKLVAAGDGIVASTCGENPMPPAFFPRDVWPEMLKTSGDAGARGLLQTASLVVATLSELHDIDVPADLPDTPRR